MSPESLQVTAPDESAVYCNHYSKKHLGLALKSRISIDKIDAAWVFLDLDFSNEYQHFIAVVNLITVPIQQIASSMSYDFVSQND